MPMKAIEIIVHDMHRHGDMKFGNGSERNCIENLNRKTLNFGIAQAIASPCF
jgi:hypothetical protein